MEKSLRAIELARRLDNPQAEANSHFYAWADLASTGELEGAGSHAAAWVGPAERVRDRGLLTSAVWTNEVVSGFAGDRQTARDFSVRSLAVSPVDPRLLATRAVLEFEVGNFSQGEVYLDRLLAAMGGTAPGPNFYYAFPAMVIPIVARITGTFDRLEIAKAAAEPILSSPVAIPYFALWPG